MEEFYKFLETNGIDKNYYSISKIDIDDFVIYLRKVSQNFTSTWMQNKEEAGEWLDQRKKEISKTHIFDKNELPLGKSIIYGMQPGTFSFDDCKTCDGHGEIDCPKCKAQGELICPTCNGKTYLERKEITFTPIEKTCNACNGSGNHSIQCNFCRGKGIIEKKERCFSCGGRGIDKDGRTCQNCRGQGFLQRNEKCNHCNGGQITKTCMKCGGKGTITENQKNENTKIDKCGNCRGTGRIICNYCGGNRTVLCKTCHGERKTFQYELNKFELNVEIDPYFTNENELNLDKKIGKLILLTPKNKVKGLTNLEKEKILEVVKKEGIKVNDETLSKVKGTLFRFKNKETNIIYYVYHNLKNGEFYFETLPPKNSFDAKLDLIIEKFKNIFKPLIKKLTDWYHGRKNY